MRRHAERIRIGKIVDARCETEIAEHGKLTRCPYQATLIARILVTNQEVHICQECLKEMQKQMGLNYAIARKL